MTSRDTMRSRDIFWGIFFILLGTLLILEKYHLIEIWWNMHDIWRLWPLILVVIGMNLISRRTEVIYKVATVLLLLAFGYIVVYGYQLQNGCSGVGRISRPASRSQWSGLRSGGSPLEEPVFFVRFRLSIGRLGTRQVQRFSR